MELVPVNFILAQLYNAISVKLPLCSTGFINAFVTPKIHPSDYYYDVVRKNIKKYRKEKGHTLQSLSEAADIFSRNRK